MATNITQKDRTLDGLLAHLDLLADGYDAGQRAAVHAGSVPAAFFLAGQLTCIGDLKQWIRDHYGYSGGMPLEVPNKSEGAS